MHRFFLEIAIPLFIAALVSPAAAQEEAAAEQPFENPAAELSYVLGIEVGNSLKRFSSELDFDVFMQAVQTSFKGETSLVAPERAREVKREFLNERRKQAIAERQAAAEKNRAEGEAFLAENKTKEGVMTTESGLQYQVIKEGDGPKPNENDSVTVHYKGTLLDGTEFDSSYTRGRPAKFPVKGVIAGWTEALQLMPVGSTYRLFVPANLAYGEQGGGRKIAPNSTLIFEVELLEIAAAPEPTAAEPQPAAPKTEAETGKSEPMGEAGETAEQEKGAAASASE